MKFEPSSKDLAEDKTYVSKAVKENIEAINSATETTFLDGILAPSFTVDREMLNGRIAMMGFLVGVITEVVNPAHPGFIEQLKLMFAPISNLIS